MLIQKTPAEIGGNVWMLGTVDYPVYLVRGTREGAVIEGGISALGPLLAVQLKQLGVGSDYLRQVVITHAHPDHVMAIPALRAMFPGLSVLASAAAAATLNAEKAVAFFRQIDTALTDVLYKSGAIAEVPAPPVLAENRIAVDRVVREGDVIAVDDLSWIVLETPGHSDCSISLHDAARGVLVISDATGYYLRESGTWWPNYFSSYAAYVRSMERLAAMDAEILCLSHNGALVGREDVRAYFAAAIAATREYHQRIVTAARAGKTVRLLAEELGAEIHRQTPVLPLDFFQKNCGMLVKQSLKHEGVSP
jgi:glyoxylase-like metal-dependent hydrolase (beta-lactamase superfamily II)